jgi:transposase-like protein
MGTVRRYSPEVRERAIRMVVDHRGEYPSQWAAIESVASKLGMTPETLRHWVRRAEIDMGARAGITTDAKARMRENEELKRANEILKAASVFFATELDGGNKKTRRK